VSSITDITIYTGICGRLMDDLQLLIWRQ